MPQQQTAGWGRYRAMLMERKGPLPVWAWIVMVLALLLLFTWWRRNKASAGQNEAMTGSGSDTFGNSGAPPIFLIPPGTGVPQVSVHVDPAATAPTAPPGAGAPSPTAEPQTVPAPGPNVNLYDWVNDLNSRYSLGYSTAGAAFVALFGNEKGEGAINPGYRKYIGWKPGTGGSAVPYFNPNWSGRNPPLGIPPVRIR